MNKRKYIKWICLIVWMIVIFLFSNQPHSGQATHSIIEQVLPILKEPKQIDLTNFIIRKIAHFSEYFILTLLIYSVLKEYKINNKKRFIYSIIFCILYACTDEFHQIFVIGRTATIRDCIIDTMGGMFYLIVHKILKNKK